MSVFRKHRGKRITSKDKDWSKGTWYMWKRVDGRIIHKALKTAQTKEEAEHAEREEIRRAFDKQYGRGSRERFDEFVERVYRPYVAQHNVNQAVKRTYIGYLLQALGKRALGDITPQDCRNVQAAFRKKYSASTVNQLMSTLGKIFTLAKQERVLTGDKPTEFVKRLKEPPPRTRLLTSDERERLWTELEKDPLLQSFCTLATNLPLRRGQLLALSPDAIDWERGLLHATGSKGRERRAVPLNSTAMNTLRSLTQIGALPFPLKETGVRKRWVKVLKRAGIENFRFHDLRKELATDLRRNNVHSKVIQDLYGHSSMKITDVYLPPQFEDMRAAMNSLDEKAQEVGGVQ